MIRMQNHPILPGVRGSSEQLQAPAGRRQPREREITQLLTRD